MGVEKFFKEHIMEIKPYLSEFIKLYGPHLLREFWMSDELIRMMTNENLFGPSPKVIEAIKEYAKNVYRYPEPTCIELREKLAEYNHVEPENIYLSPGSLSALDAIFRGILEPDDNIVLALPTYDPYLLRLQVVGAKAKLVQMKEPEFDRDIEGMLNAVDSKTKIVILMNPHNPVGKELPQSDVEPFLEKDVLLVIDEAYFEFHRQTYLNLLKDHENVVILRTMSKAFGIADLRVGYLIGNEKIVDYLGKIALPFQIPTIVAVAAKAALEDIDYMRKTTDIIIQEREKMFRELSKFGDLKPYP